MSSGSKHSGEAGGGSAAERGHQVAGEGAGAVIASRGRRTNAAVRAAVASDLVTDTSPVVGFVDLDAVAASQAQLRAAFAATPAPVLHTFAAKAASLVPVLRLFAEAGLGCEVASPGELAQALAAGFPPERIVLDSPTKTTTELREALRLGVAINADNFTELARIDTLLGELGQPGPGRPALPRQPLGLRINPQVGAGSIEAMSTASIRSKFGVPLADEGGRQAIIAAFERYPWLTRLHVHVGSQGCPLDLIAAGIRRVYELAEEINALPAEGAGPSAHAAPPGGRGPENAVRRRVTSIDIGGGLPVNFDGDEVTPTFAEYVDVLRTAMPGLFDGRYQLVTEFGRSLIAKNGFTLARVEYAKQVADRRVALTHAGSQVATRTVFMPESWPLRISAYTADGEPKQAPLRIHDVAGPCCFAGDLVARGREMEELDEGDLVLLHDTAGYAFTAPWTYNSVPRPAVYAYRASPTGDVHLTALRRQQTLAELVAETGGDPAVLKAYAQQQSASGAAQPEIPEPSHVEPRVEEPTFA